MNQETLESELAELALGALCYQDRVGSTNTVAAEWAAHAAPHLSLVVAGEQTDGRGRTDRKWFTPPGAAIAFSLILHAEALNISNITKIPLVAGLGAVAVSQALQQFGLVAQIKWPNDVLLSGSKVAGVLAELSWSGEIPSALILGIGINVAPSAVPPEDWDAHHAHPFPATSVETVLGQPVDRLCLLRFVLTAVLDWLPRWESAAFLDAWRGRLAMRGAWVQIIHPLGAMPPLEGIIINLNEDGSLRIKLRSGEHTSVRVGDIHLRLVDSSSK
jgi:BirA family biotin operon repressor/biotin-[acetyl-CoA-carboxylase] ligase